MVKHNNVLPNAHFHKDWQERVKVTLDRPGRKLRRRLTRKAKAQAIAPRPIAGLLRPAVKCPTQQYNTKLRAGRGFTLEELKEAGINRKEARSIGVAVDHRRRNHCVESLNLNVARLKEFKARLIVFPRKNGKIKNGDSSAEEIAAAAQLAGDLIPIVQKNPTVCSMVITDDIRKQKARTQLKMAESRLYLEGKRRWAKAEGDE